MRPELYKEERAALKRFCKPGATLTDAQYFLLSEIIFAEVLHRDAPKAWRAKAIAAIDSRSAATEKALRDKGYITDTEAALKAGIRHPIATREGLALHLFVRHRN